MRVFIAAWPTGRPDAALDVVGRAGRGPIAAHSARNQGWLDDGDSSAVAGGAGADGLTLLPTPKARDFRSDSPSDRARKSPALHAVGTLLPTPRTNDMRGAGEHGDGGPDLRTAVALLPTPRATDGTKGGPNQRGSSGDLMLPSAVMLLPTPTARLGRTGGNPERGDRAGRTSTGPDLADATVDALRWGQYAPAIARWAAVTGRPAPEPTEPGAKGQPRLSPRFVEWLMGLPAGHVTDHCTRTEALRGLGNGVVPQQCAAAFAQLVDVLRNEAPGRAA